MEATCYIFSETLWFCLCKYDSRDESYLTKGSTGKFCLKMFHFLLSQQKNFHHCAVRKIKKKIVGPSHTDLRLAKQNLARGSGTTLVIIFRNPSFPITHRGKKKKKKLGLSCVKLRPA